VNKFEFVTVSGARARQLLKGSTPRTTGPVKLARVAMKEVKEKRVEKIPAHHAEGIDKQA
jgi:DNA-directed RNA polymerase subunit K/omega